MMQLYKKKKKYPTHFKKKRLLKAGKRRGIVYRYKNGKTRGADFGYVRLKQQQKRLNTAARARQEKIC